MPNFRLRLAFSLLLITALANAVVAQQPATAAQLWQQIQQRYAKAPPADTVDTLKAGDPATPVTGIATTFLDTMAVLQEAAKRGDNLIVTHEPTFYNHRDDTSAFQQDPVYLEKLHFIQQHHLVVYRLHDQIHADPQGDHILAGAYAALGWQQLQHPAGSLGQYFATVPPTTLGALVQYLQQRLHGNTMRVVGDPGMPVTHIAFLPGSSGLGRQVLALNQPAVEVLIAGEASEWETVEYVRDAVTQGRHKALVLLGHEISEEPGMEQCAQELRILFPAMRVDHLAAGQPLWNPEHPPGR